MTNTPMTADELAESKKRCDAATPGPWRLDERGNIICPTALSIHSVIDDVVLSTEDAAFIAAARADIPRLHATIDELVTALRLALDGATDTARAILARRNRSRSSCLRRTAPRKCPRGPFRGRIRVLLLQTCPPSRNDHKRPLILPD